MAPGANILAHGLTFWGMTHLGLNHGYDLSFSAANRALKLYLCVGREDNRVLVSGTTPLSRQAAVLDAIDELEKWSEVIEVWMVGELNEVITARTQKKAFFTHVKPYYDELTITEFSTNEP